MAVDLSGCPKAIKDPKINVKNHLEAIATKGLGPADPRQPNEDFWLDKSKKFGVMEGDARARLCCTCRFYVNTTQMKQFIMETETRNLKASALPLKPKWADIESFPQAYCTLLDITCSPIRTCDFQLMGGPIDDDKIKLPVFAKMLEEDLKEEENGGS